MLHGDCRLPRSHAGDNTVGADRGNVLVSGLIADGAGGVEGCQGAIFAGKYHTAFRGRGMSFSEVREYRAGDDVRDIDWNVTPGMGF